MADSLLEQRGANFYGFESIDSSGKHHFHPAVNRGNGDLYLSERGIYFKQWLTNNKYKIPLDKITKLEIKNWHNMKIKWPGKVLRIYFKEQTNTKIFGVAPGGEFSIASGWQDDAYLWKEKIESLLKEKF